MWQLPYLFQQFLTFFWRLITMFTTACHLFHCWARGIQSKPCHPITLKYTQILFLCLYISLKDHIFHLGLPNKTLCVFLSFLLYVNMCFPYHSSWFDNSANMWWRVQIIMPVIIKLSSTSCYSPSPSPSCGPKYLPQRPVLKCCKPMFFH